MRAILIDPSILSLDELMNHAPLVAVTPLELRLVRALTEMEDERDDAKDELARLQPDES
jgi:hypothetical protein